MTQTRNEPPALQTRRAEAAPDAIAPDGSEVRLLCAGPRGGMALFTLPPWPGATEAVPVAGAWEPTG